MNKTKKIGGILLSLLLIGVIVMVIMKSNASPSICFETTCYQIRIADDQQERKQGLMYVETLPTDEGMLFLFPTGDIYSFRMKNTLIPLDIIWINTENTIVDIQTAQPCTQDPCPLLTPKTTADKVLEINAGQAQSKNLKIGQHVELNLPYTDLFSH